MSSVPVSPYQQISDIYYFPRMTDKIRLHARENLREDLQANLGQGFDAFMCHFLGVEYDQVQELATQGKDDNELLEWCFENGRRLTSQDITCLLYTSPSPRDGATSRMPSSA